jgi:hypothetical protein
LGTALSTAALAARSGPLTAASSFGDPDQVTARLLETKEPFDALARRSGEAPPELAAVSSGTMACLHHWMSSK